MKAAEIVALIREERDLAARQAKTNHDERARYGWECREQQCRELLHNIVGTDENDS